MLESFVGNEKESKKIKPELLKNNVKEIFISMGENESDSSLAADTLVLADLRGGESHGVSNMLRSYVEQYKNKELKPKAEISIIKDNLASCSIDGDQGLGIITTPKAMDIAIEKAKKTGIGVVTINNS